MSGEPELWWEHRQYPVGPGRTFRGVPCSVSIVDVVQVKADPNPLPRFHLFRHPKESR